MSYFFLLYFSLHHKYAERSKESWNRDRLDQSGHQDDKTGEASELFINHLSQVWLFLRYKTISLSGKMITKCKHILNYLLKNKLGNKDWKFKEDKNYT